MIFLVRWSFKERGSGGINMEVSHFVSPCISIFSRRLFILCVSFSESCDYFSRIVKNKHTSRYQSKIVINFPSILSVSTLSIPLSIWARGSLIINSCIFSMTSFLALSFWNFKLDKGCINIFDRLSSQAGYLSKRIFVSTLAIISSQRRGNI